MKVGIIDNSNGQTGAIRSIRAITRTMQDITFVYFLPSGSAVIKELEHEQISVYQIRFNEIRKTLSVIAYIPMLIWNSIKIAGISRREKLDVIHVNDMYNMCGVILKWLRPSLKVIYHVRLLPSSYIGSLYGGYARLIKWNADAIVSVSQAVRKALLLCNVESQVIYDGVPQVPHPPRRPAVGNTGSLVLLYLANFMPGKGHAYAIEAFHRSIGIIPNLRMIMAGGDLGLEKNALFKKRILGKIESLGLMEKIEVRGMQRDVYDLITSCDLFLNFSDSESFSITCLEALSVGTPLIATDSGGPGELFQHEESGLLVPVGDVDAMRDAIVRLCLDSGLREKFSLAGAKFVRDKFNLHKSAVKLEELYTYKS